MPKSSFSLAAERARERGELRLAKRIEAERRVSFALVDALLKRGCVVSVDYDGEFGVEKSAKREEIRAALFACDMEWIKAYRDGKSAGMWILVYGNDGYDVISDWFVNDLANEIEAELQPLIDKIEAEMA